MPSVAAAAAAAATAGTGSDDEPTDPAADDVATTPSPVFAFLEGDFSASEAAPSAAVAESGPLPLQPREEDMLG